MPALHQHSVRGKAHSLFCAAAGLEVPPFQNNGLIRAFLDQSFHRSAFAPAELAAEDVEEAVGAGAEEVDAVFGTAAVDLVADVEFHGLLTIDGEEGVGDAVHVDGDGGVAGNDDRADGQQVGAEGRNDEGVDRGHYDGAAGGQIVGGRAGGGRDDDAVGTHGCDELLVDLDGEVGHACDGALGDGDVVEGVPTADRLTVATQLGVHHVAHFDACAVGAPGLKGGVEVGEGDLGEEAEGSEVDAEDGGRGVGERAGCGEKGAVATQDDYEVGSVSWELGALDGVWVVDVGGAIGVEETAIGVAFEPCDEFAQDDGELGLLRLGDDGGLEH